MSELAQSCNAVSVEKTLELLVEAPVAVRESVEGGYIDLLGGHDPIGPSFAQKTMRNRTVVRVYEWYWRPVVSRAFFGVFGPLAAKERRIAMEMLGVSKGERVLDVGCGPGNYTKHLARAAGDGLVIGLDASQPMLASATQRTRGANLAYVRGDAGALPFRDESFDVVSCFGTLHLIEDPMKALDEMVRVLGAGGRLGLLATCEGVGRRRARAPKGIWVFGREELTAALAIRGLIDVQQRVIGRGQFIAAHKPEG